MMLEYLCLEDDLISRAKEHEEEFERPDENIYCLRYETKEPEGGYMYVYIENNDNYGSDNYIYKEKVSLTTYTGLKLANKRDKKLKALESGYELEVGPKE